MEIISISLELMKCSLYFHFLREDYAILEVSVIASGASEQIHKPSQDGYYDSYLVFVEKVTGYFIK